MKRTGIYRPTIEDAVELSGIETLHPGGLALTKRTAEVAELRPGLKILDVSSGRGAQAVYYAQEYGAFVIGIDIAAEMVAAARSLAYRSGVSDKVHFTIGDSMTLPFHDASFDVTINECAVGIPSDPQRVLNEMVRVVKYGGRIVIHESTWRKPLTVPEKQEIAERYGTTPFEPWEWVEMLARAGATDVKTEVERWSKPENFWKIRKDRDVAGPGQILTPIERMHTVQRIFARFGLPGVFTALQNERIYYRAVLDGQLGYGLYWGQRPPS